MKRKTGLHLLLLALTFIYAGCFTMRIETFEIDAKTPPIKELYLYDGRNIAFLGNGGSIYMKPEGIRGTMADSTIKFIPLTEIKEYRKEYPEMMRVTEVNAAEIVEIVLKSGTYRRASAGTCYFDAATNVLRGVDENGNAINIHKDNIFYVSRQLIPGIKPDAIHGDTASPIAQVFSVHSKYLYTFNPPGAKYIPVDTVVRGQYYMGDTLEVRLAEIAYGEIENRKGNVYLGFTILALSPFIIEQFINFVRYHFNEG